MAEAANKLLRNLPSVDELLRSEPGSAYVAAEGPAAASLAARAVIERLREEIGSGWDADRRELLSRAENELADLLRRETSSGVRHVINASGVIIHTNLGRAPLSAAARQAI